MRRDREHEAYAALGDPQTLEPITSELDLVEMAFDLAYGAAIKTAALPRQNGGAVALAKLRSDVIPSLVKLRSSVDLVIEQLQKITKEEEVP